MIKLLRKPAVLELYGVKTSTFDKMVAEQQFTPPVHITERLQAWPDYEVEAINRARIAGQTAEQIRDLVMSLVNERKVLADNFSTPVAA